MNSIKVSDYNNICRLCLTKVNKTKLFSLIEHPTLVKQIQQLTDVDVSVKFG